MMPTWPQLAAFLSLAETRSFTAAAEALGVSQPTLSRTIQALEAATGTKLFDRDTRSIALTSAGLEFLMIARRLTNEMESAAREFREVAHGERGRLTIAALPSIAAVILPGAIARFRLAHPAVDIIIHDGLSEPVLAMVADGRADAGITVRPPTSTRLVYRMLLADRFCLVGRRDRPDEGAVPWAILAQEPFIAMSPASSVRTMTDAAFLQAGISPVPRFECAQLSTTGGLVAAGLGITALPRLAIALIAGHDLVVRPLVKPLLQRSIGIVVRASRQPSPAMVTFLQAITAEAADLSKVAYNTEPQHGADTRNTAERDR